MEKRNFLMVGYIILKILAGNRVFAEILLQIGIKHMLARLEAVLLVFW